jgi:hypothetical protein
MAENNNHQVANLPKHPHPELRKLDPLIGRWRIEGPDVKGEVTYEWMEGGFFFIQHYDLVNFGSHHKGIEYAGWDEDTGTIRSRLMGTDGSRFTYTYQLDGNVLLYWFGEKNSPLYSRSVLAPDGRSMEGRWYLPTEKDPGFGYDFRVTRIDRLARAAAG